MCGTCSVGREFADRDSRVFSVVGTCSVVRVC